MIHEVISLFPLYLSLKNPIAAFISYSEGLSIEFLLFIFQDADSLPDDNLIDCMFSVTFHSRLFYPSIGPFYSPLIFVRFTSVSLVSYYISVFKSIYNIFLISVSEHGAKCKMTELF